MSYYAKAKLARRSRVRRGMGTAVEYDPVGSPVIVRSPPPPPVKTARSLRGFGSLGDDASNAAISDVPNAQLDELRQIRAFQERWVATVESEKLQRWIQIGVTASIPLFAAIWRVIFKTGRE